MSLLSPTQTLLLNDCIFLILIGLEGSLLPLTELHVHRAILHVRLINLMSQLVRTQI
jgi:hypothetical protein